MAGDGLEDLCRTDPQTAPLVEKPDLNEGYGWHVAKRSTAVGRRKTAAGGLPEPARLGQVPHKGMRVSDELEHASRHDGGAMRRSAPEPPEIRRVSELARPGRGRRARDADAVERLRQDQHARQFPVRSTARPVGTANGLPETRDPRRDGASARVTARSEPHPSLYSIVSGPHHEVQNPRDPAATSSADRANVCSPAAS